MSELEPMIDATAILGMSHIRLDMAMRAAEADKAELVEKLTITRKHLNDLLSGRTDLLSIKASVVIELSNALNVDVLFLLGLKLPTSGEAPNE